MIKELADLLASHPHAYDSDCGIDYGCLCGEITDYDESDIAHEDHLAAVIERHFDIKPISN